jgi:transposase
LWVPDEGHEAMRDLVRARSAAVETLGVHRQQVSAFMLKHGRIYKERADYLRWLQEQTLDYPAQQEKVETVRLAKERVKRLELAIEEFIPCWSLASIVQVLQSLLLQSLRGVDLIVAVTFVTEVGELRRFESPRQRTTYRLSSRRARRRTARPMTR